MELPKLKIWSEIIAIWVTVVGIFVGGTFALVEYYDNKKSDQIRVTLNYVDRFNKAPILDVRSRIDSFWYARSKTIFKKADAGEDELIQFILNTIQENELEKDTDLLISYYDGIEICTCGKLCDPVTVKRYFSKQAYDLYGLYYPYLVQKRNELKDETYGLALELVAGSHGSEENFFDMICRSNNSFKSDANKRRSFLARLFGTA